MQIAPFGQTSGLLWNAPPPVLRILLGGRKGMSRLEVVGPDGEVLTFTPEQIMEALR